MDSFVALDEMLLLGSFVQVKFARADPYRVWKSFNRRTAARTAPSNGIAVRADVTAVGAWSCTPLSCAARAGHGETVKFLIRHGADVKYRTADGTCRVAQWPRRSTRNIMNRLTS